MRPKNSWASSKLTPSTGRSGDLNSLGLSPITAVQRRWVHGVSASHKPSVRVTRCCGPSSSKRPTSVSGEPIMKRPGGIQRIRKDAGITDVLSPRARRLRTVRTDPGLRPAPILRRLEAATSSMDMRSDLRVTRRPRDEERRDWMVPAEGPGGFRSSGSRVPRDPSAGSAGGPPATGSRPRATRKPKSWRSGSRAGTRSGTPRARTWLVLFQAPPRMTRLGRFGLSDLHRVYDRLRICRLRPKP